MNPSALDCLKPTDFSNATAVEPRLEDDQSVLLRDFLAANYARLHRRLIRHLGCPDLASECLHDAWLRLGEQMRPACVQSPEAYVYRVACNVAVDRLRGMRSSLYVDEAVLQYLVDPNPGPDLIAELRSDLTAVECAMLHLPRRHRAVLMAIRIEEKTRQEVAQKYHVSLTSVDRMLRQALAHCVEEMGQTATEAISGRASHRFSQQWRAKAAVTAATAIAHPHQRNDTRHQKNLKTPTSVTVPSFDVPVRIEPRRSCPDPGKFGRYCGPLSST